MRSLWAVRLPLSKFAPPAFVAGLVAAAQELDVLLGVFEPEDLPTLWRVADADPPPPKKKQKERKKQRKATVLV